MRDLAAFRRTCAAAGLLLTPVIAIAWTALMPPFPAGYAERLAAIDEGGASAAVSAALFVLMQLPMLAAVLGIAHLIGQRAPVLASLGAVLSVLGVLGHSVWGGVMLVATVMAGDTDNRTLYAELLESVETSPVMIVSAFGGLGMVLGTVVLAAGLWRSQVAPRWVPGLLWLFIVVEFAGQAVSEHASYVAGLCLLVAFAALAQRVWQSPRDSWDPQDTFGAREPATA